MLIQKNVWDFIKIGSKFAPIIIWEQKTAKENCMVIRIVTRIIKKGISNNIFNNIIDITNPHEI